MGSSSTKSCGILITFQQSSFRNSDTISGKINIKVKQPVMNPVLIIRFKGREKTSFEEKITTHSPAGKKTENQVLKGKKLICDESFIINRWKSPLVKGDYALPFTFQPPPKLPGSFFYDSDKTLASISYKIFAELQSEDGEKYTDKRPVHISEKFEDENIGEISRFSQYRLISCCCLKRGTCSMEVVSIQDTYNPSQIAEIDIKAHVQGSELAIKKVNCKLIYNLRVKADNGMRTFRTGRLLETSTSVNSKKNGLMSDCAVSLNINLPTIKQKLEKRYSTKGSLIDFGYTLEVRAFTTGRFMCKGEKPKILHNIYIVADPVIVPSAPEASEDWDPYEYGVFAIDPSFSEKYTPSAPPYLE